jgi:hypothetical protein
MDSLAARHVLGSGSMAYLALAAHLQCEILARCCRVWVDKEADDELDPSAVLLAEAVLKVRQGGWGKAASSTRCRQGKRKAAAVGAAL